MSTIKANLTQRPKRAADKVDRQKNYIRWMLRTVKSVHVYNDMSLINASNKIK